MSAFSRSWASRGDVRFESHGIQAELTPMRQAHPRGALPKSASTPNQQTLRTIEQERNALVVELWHVNAAPVSRNARNGKRVRERAQVPDNLRR